MRRHFVPFGTNVDRRPAGLDRLCPRAGKYQRKILYISSISAADDLTQRELGKYPYFIRTGWTSSQPTHAIGKWACEQAYKRVVSVAADYAFGYEQQGGFQKAFEDCGGKVIQKSGHRSARRTSGRTFRRLKETPMRSFR
jgi:ABC-type branched-subunit amino acid transport system substrate-binding protein